MLVVIEKMEDCAEKQTAKLKFDESKLWLM